MIKIKYLKRPAAADRFEIRKFDIVSDFSFDAWGR